MDMGAIGLPADRVEAAVKRASGKSLQWRLILLYQYGCLAALAVTFLLVLIGLEMTGRQWIVLFMQLPFGVALYTLADIWLIARHVGPVRAALEPPDLAAAGNRDRISQGLVRALNLPFLSFMRVTFLHGPMVSALVLIVTIGTEFHFKAGFQLWQAISFAVCVLLFASPTHAIFEYFAVSREMVPIILRLNNALGVPLGAEHQARLISVKLRSKLLYIAIFVTTLPLIFFGVGVVFKIERMLAARGVSIDFTSMLPFYTWMAGTIGICVVGAVLLAFLTASEVSRSASRLITAMERVEGGQLDDIRLEVVSTDEYGDIFRGFQLMVESLREEQKILAVSQELAGELKLDLLIARIMRATTELLGADRSTLLIHDPKTDQLYSLYAEGNQIREIRIPANRGIAGAVFNSGTLENIADAYADPRFDMSVDRETGFATRSILCAPIANKAGGRIGVTQVLNKKLGAFTVKDEARLRAFSAQIAVCLENAKLFDDVLSMKNYNESILKSTSNAIVTFDEDAVIVTTNPAAQQLLGGNRDSLIGQPGATVFAGQNGWIIDALDRALETGRMSIAVDTEIAHAQTSASSVNVTTAPLIDAGDNRIGSMLVIEDITREKRVRSTMARYMSKEVADQLIEAGEDVLGGKDQQVSILFADVRGFTTLAENTSARETVSMLNEYFTDMVDVIFAHGGILDKYIGDAMMALFGAPFTGPHDADNAVAAANQMMTALAALNQRRADRGGKPIEIGLGISTGEVVVGNIGSSKRMEYTVIGDSVNLASRLEGTNKFYGTRILFSQFTMAQLKQPRHVREVDLVRVKGKDQPVKVFEALGYRASAEGAALEAMLEHYRDAISAYRAHQWQAADAGFAAALHCRPGDGPSLIYRDRCRRFIATPPPVEWDGVWEMQSK